MPGGDGTGPLGMGPMTGRAAGFCAGDGTPGFANPIAGRGRGRSSGGGRGFGRGRGYGRGRGFGCARGAFTLPATSYGVPYAPEPTPEQEATALRAQAEHLDGMLADIRRRLNELAGSSAEGEQ